MNAYAVYIKGLRVEYVARAQGKILRLLNINLTEERYNI